MRRLTVVCLYWAKLTPGGPAQELEDGLEARRHVVPGRRQAVAQVSQLGGHAVERQHEVDHAGGDGRQGHAVVAGGHRILREGGAPGGLDGLEPEGGVGRGPRQHHADGPLAELEGERAKEVVDGHRWLAPTATRLQAEGTLLDGHRRVGRDDVDVVRTDAQAMGSLEDRHLGRAGERAAEQAAVGRIEVLDEHQGRARVGGEVLEERAKGLEAAGRGAHADEGNELAALAALGALAALAAVGDVGHVGGRHRSLGPGGSAGPAQFFFGGARHGSIAAATRPRARRSR